MSFFKAELHCLGLKRRDFYFISFFKVRQTGNYSMRVGPNLPGQVGAPLEHAAHHPNPTNWSTGVPLEHTAHYPNPTNWSSGCPTGTRCTPPKPHKLVKQLPVCSVHLTCLFPGGSCFCFMPDGALPSNCCTLEQKFLMPMKQSSPA